MKNIRHLSYDVFITPNATIKSISGHGGENFQTFFGIICIWLLLLFTATCNHRKYHGRLSSLVTMRTDTFKYLILLLASFVINLVLLPVALMAIFPLVVLRIVVYIILKSTYGDKFGGLLEGADVIWAIEDVSKSISNALLLVESEGCCDDFFQSVKTTIYEKFFHNPQHFPKLLSVKLYSLGYYFYLKNEFTLVDCIKQVVIDEAHEEVSETQLQEFVSSQLNETMPKNHQGLWEVLVVMNKMKHKGCSSYPLVFRFHHSLADGASLLRILIECLADNIPGQIFESEQNKFRGSIYKENEEPQQELKEYGPYNMTFHVRRLFHRITAENYFPSIEYLHQRFTVLLAIFTAPLDVIIENATRKIDDNELHGPPLSGDKLAVWKIESDYQYLPLLKRVKNKLNCYRFSDILLTAISGSFAEFYEKHSVLVPHAITVVLPVINIHEFRRKNDGSANTESLTLKNSFRVGLLNLPISAKDCEQPHASIESRMEEVKRQTDSLRNSKSFHMNYCIMSLISTVLPVSILAPLLQRAAHCTLVVSSMPGTQKLTVFRNKRLMDIACFVPNKGSTGLSLAVLTYDGRFQIGLTVDKALIPEKDKAQELVDGIFKYLSCIEEEMMKVSKNDDISQIEIPA